MKDLLGLGSEEPLGLRGGAAGDLLDKLQLGVLHVDGGDGSEIKDQSNLI